MAAGVEDTLPVSIEVPILVILVFVRCTLENLMRPIFACLVTALLVFPLVAAAQSRIPSLDQEGRMGDVGRAAQKKAVERFDHADTDKDGKLSRPEVATHSEYMAGRFDQMDNDGDGALSWEEFIGHDRWKKE